ncbi:imidazole glycerol phosphate synthase subunit HisH [Flavobacterium sp. FlaQc-30]|uniref:imidazole glycerol phosphate synthase subunit HisH n=1 Tax=Flavobacterium sp. FlaQc-30 TaxID=3374179 RepID=UPI00375755D0
MVTIIDYGIGNLTSIKNMLKKVGSNSIISSDIDEISKADKLILPGVGSFEYSIKKLRSMDYFSVLEEKVLIDHTPVLGVCLGAQLLMDVSEEGAETPGLGWIKGKVLKFDKSKLGAIDKIPHMGWNEVTSVKDSKLTLGFDVDPRFYFVHSYHMVCDNANDALFQTTYGYPFVSGVERDNILGVQFHPEKSHKFGMKLYSNFVNNY